MNLKYISVEIHDFFKPSINILLSFITFFSVPQAFFERQPLQMNASSAFQITCMFRCMKNSRCRAFYIDADQNGNLKCTIVNDTSGVTAEQVSRRLYPMPTPKGEYTHF